MPRSSDHAVAHSNTRSLSSSSIANSAAFLRSSPRASQRASPPAHSSSMADASSADARGTPTRSVSLAKRANTATRPGAVSTSSPSTTWRTRSTTSAAASPSTTRFVTQRTVATGSAPGVGLTALDPQVLAVPAEVGADPVASPPLPTGLLLHCAGREGATRGWFRGDSGSVPDALGRGPGAR